MGLGLSSGVSLSAEEPAAPDWDRIAFEVRSWGATVTRWQYTPDYGGVWVEVERKAESAPPVWTLTYHEIEPDPVRFDTLAAIVARLPDPAPDSDDCGNMMSDQHYGTIRMTRGATTTEIKWNAGCLDDSYKAFMDVLSDADQLVAGWGRASTNIRTEDSLIP